MLLSDRKKVKTVKQLSQQAVESVVEESKGSKFTAQLREFGNIGGYSGVCSLAWRGCGVLLLYPYLFMWSIPTLVHILYTLIGIWSIPTLVDMWSIPILLHVPYPEAL